MSRILPRYTDQAIPHDPLAIAIAQQEARTQAAKDNIAAGSYKPHDPADLRGIPCTARGVGGTAPGTDPLAETIRLDQQRNRKAA